MTSPLRFVKYPSHLKYSAYCEPLHITWEILCTFQHKLFSSLHFKNILHIYLYLLVLIFFSTFLIFFYLMFVMPQKHQDKSLVCEDLLGNKPNSDLYQFFSVLVVVLKKSTEKYCTLQVPSPFIAPMEISTPSAKQFVTREYKVYLPSN